MGIRRVIIASDELDSGGVPFSAYEDEGEVDEDEDEEDEEEEERGAEVGQKEVDDSNEVKGEAANKRGTSEAGTDSQAFMIQPGCAATP